jgi:chromate transporter
MSVARDGTPGGDRSFHRDPGDPARVPFREALRVWTRIGLASFGGPAGQIALMHRELVERRRWIDEARFLHALNYCMLLPGPEAQQLATYVGWLMHRTAGGLAAGVLFVLPGFVAILALSALYASLRELPAVSALFFGLKAAVLAVVIEAVLRVGKRALKGRVALAVAAVAFLALFLFGVPFPAIVLATGALGFLLGRVRPDAFAGAGPSSAPAGSATVIERMAAAGELAHTRPSLRRAVMVVVVCVTLWGAPPLLAHTTLGPDSVFVEVAAFFSKAAVVTFGGAYSVLAYVAQQAVENHGWLRPGEMLDGLGLAETTPGPLILVLEFVGFVAAFRDPGALPPMLAGVLGALMTVWVTFVPCFLWIFLGAPYVEALRASLPLRAALSMITAAVVGVILNLSLWFGLHVLFADVVEVRVGFARVLAPAPSSLDPAAAVLVAVAMLALFRFKLGLSKTLALSAALGLAWKLLAPSGEV